MKLLSYLNIKVTGACVERFLSVLAEKRIFFSEIERIDELHYRILVRSKDLKVVQELAIGSFCTCEVLEKKGLQIHWKKMLKRPVLLVGMVCALFLSFYMQTFVLAIEVSGNEALHQEEIIRALEAIDISVGSNASQIDQQLSKNRMLNELPQLSWVGVNRSGFKLNVLVTERSEAQSNRPQYPAANIVAVRESTVTEMIVSEGMKLCKVGDTVQEGQILVSGFEDYGLILKGVCAEAEIYGQTWYSGMLAMPTQTYEKRYTGRQWTQYSLCIGRKRINLSGNSRISGTTCDKMIEVTELAVPEYQFPIKLEKITYCEYELVAETIDEEAAQQRLNKAWQELLLSQMVAGRILDTETAYFASGGVYILRAQSTCNEMIARMVPMEPVFEGEKDE